MGPGNHSTDPASGWGWRWLPAVLLALSLLAGCDDRTDVLGLSVKAKTLWEAGQYADAARNFVTLAEIYPGDPLAQESLFWAASLYQHFLADPEQAIRFYQHLLVQYPGGGHGIEARENLAALYEADKTQRHRALQIYQQLLLNDDTKGKRDFYQFKVGAINLKMGRLDQARFEFRALLEKHPNSSHLPKAYYLIGYSYFLEERFPLALVAFKQTIKDFPGTLIANQAQFFIADTLEEKGELKAALAMFRSLQNKSYNQKILDRRIKSLRARMRKGVR